MRICSVEGCTRVHAGRGYCAVHYQKWRRTATAEDLAQKYITDEARFKLRYDHIGSCWIWRTPAKDGYGRFHYRGRQIVAHRAAYEIHIGPVPQGLHVDHLCNNRACVNPEHLEAVTQAENNARIFRRGRGAPQKRTHCPQGHEYTPENTYNRPGRQNRECRTCRDAQARQRHARARISAA